jgi:arylsulfatase A-like enzyme
MNKFSLALCVSLGLFSMVGSQGLPVSQGSAGKSAPAGFQALENKKLNVVFILADDLGWRDLGCYGSTFHETPHIDALARRGLRFTQAYAASPLCSPTRASLLTGLYPARLGITAPECHLSQEVLQKGLAKEAPGQAMRLAQSVTRLKTDYYTLAKAFRAAGYATGHFGKWHLGPEPYSPLQHGFDVDVPHTSAPGPLMNGYFHPFPVWKNHGKAGDNLEDLLAEEAAQFIAQNKARPFFLNYWAFEVHSPWQAKPAQLAKYRAKARPGDPQRNPVYAGMIETLDDAVGRLVAALEQSGVLERTIIVFTSDNGPFAFAHPAPVMMAEFQDIPTTSVLPLRGVKGTIYEGGTRVPLIVAWPGVTQAGTTTDALALSTDFFPTFADLLGLNVPAGLAFDGVSLRPVLAGGAGPRKDIFCHFPHTQSGWSVDKVLAPASSFRSGDWKIIRLFGPKAGADRFELYNLRDDIGEAKNLAPENPQLVRNFATLLDGLCTDTGAVMPKPDGKARQP